MGDLKGLLDKEGIKVNPENSSDTKSPPTPDILNIDISIPADKLVQETNIPLIDNENVPDLPVLNGTISIVDEIVDENAPDSDSDELDDYLADFEEDNIELDTLSYTVKELEEKVESITEPEHILSFEQSENERQLIDMSLQPDKSLQPNNSLQLEKLKISLQTKLAIRIETQIENIKIQLLDSMKSEIEELFKNLPKN